MAKEKIIGIDLGTTNSCVALLEGNVPNVIPNAEGKRTTPSMVAFPQGSQGERKVGEPAKRQSVTNPQRTVYSVKRFIGKKYQEVGHLAQEMPYKVTQGPQDSVSIAIGDRGYTPQELSAMILQKLKGVAEDYLGHDVKKAVITVPAYFNDAERQATTEAGKIAGLEVMRIINEPTAAALAYGLDKKAGQTIAVFDLGGGTFDISILEFGEGVFEVKATHGDVNLGGDNFDQRVIDWMAATFKKEHGVDLKQQPEPLQRLREAAEKAKVDLSNSPTTEINLPFITAIDNVPKHFVATLTRAQFEELIAPDCKRLLGPCEEAMKAAGIDKDAINEVILVGGSTRIPKVQAMVEAFFGKKPSKNVNPDEVVALGAAVQGGIIAGDLKDVVLLDVTPLSLGIETMGGVFTKVIEANTTIPTKRSQVFSTAADNQPIVGIHVLQGERAMARDNKTIGNFQLDGIPAAPRGVPQIEVTFDIDVNGILHVTAQDKQTNKEQKVRIESSSNLSEEEIERMKKEAEANAEADKQEKQKVEKLNQAETTIFQTEKRLQEFGHKVDPATKEPLEKALDDLKKAHEAKDLQAIEVAMASIFPAMTAANSAFEKVQQPAQPTGEAPKEATQDNKQDANVEDAEYEEVK